MQINREVINIAYYYLALVLLSRPNIAQSNGSVASLYPTSNQASCKDDMTSLVSFRKSVTNNM